MLCTARRPKPSWPHRNGDTGLWTSASSPVGSPDYHAYTILQRATLWEAETHHFSPVIPDQLVHKSPVTGQRYPSESAGSKGVTQPSPTCMADYKVCLWSWLSWLPRYRSTGLELTEILLPLPSSVGIRGMCHHA